MKHCFIIAAQNGRLRDKGQLLAVLSALDSVHLVSGNPRGIFLETNLTRSELESHLVPRFDIKVELPSRIRLLG